MYDVAIHTRHPNWCYCVACDEWFTSDTAFDRHLGPIPKSGPPKCKRLQDVKMGKQRLIFNEAKGAWQWDGEKPAVMFEKPVEAA